MNRREFVTEALSAAAMGAAGFAQQASAQAPAQGRGGTQTKRAGAGGAIQIRAEVVPALRYEILGTPVSLKKVSMLPEQPKGENRFRDGVVGMDALWNGFLLDFDAMRLVIR